MKLTFGAFIVVFITTIGAALASPIAEAETIVKEAEGLLASSKSAKEGEEQKGLVVEPYSFSRAYSSFPRKAYGHCTVIQYHREEN